MEARRMLREDAVGTILDETYTGQMVRKWNRIVRGIRDPYVKRSTALLCENQIDWLNSLNEDTLATNVGSFAKYIFPILRRVFPNLIAHRIASVQPMNGPIGAAFTYEYKYDQTKGTINADDNLIQTFTRWYSSEYIDYEIKVADTDTDNVKTTWNDSTNQTERIPFKWLPLRPYQDIGTYVYAVKVYYTDTTLQELTDDGSGNLRDSGGTVRGTVNYTTGAFTLTLAGAPDAGTPVYATYYYNSELVGDTVAPGSGITTSLYANTDQVSEIPSLSIDLTMIALEAVSRKLRIRWSVEAADDLRAVHGLEGEQELVAGVSNQVNLEMDREVIMDMWNGAGHTATYAHGPAFGGQNVHTELDSIRGLITMIDSVSSAIHTATNRAPANFVVVSPAVGALLSQLTTHGDFLVAGTGPVPVQRPTYGVVTGDFGIQELGMLNNRYMIYQDPFMTAGNILIGLKGARNLDAGYIFGPYVPLQATPTFQDPTDMKYKKGLRSRYAKKLVRPEFYGALTVTGLPTVVSS